MKSSVKNYGTVAVLVHWVSAILIITLIGSGFRSGFSDDGFTRIAVLRVHLPAAGLVFLLTAVRLVWWGVLTLSSRRLMVSHIGKTSLQGGPIVRCTCRCWLCWQVV